MVWVEATPGLAAGARVQICEADVLHDGLVVVGPGLLLGESPAANAQVVAIETAVDLDEDLDLPLAEMPPLGSVLATPSGSGMVTALDPVRGRATATLSDGATLEVDVCHDESNDA
jgi:hypothetical protein